MRLLETCPFRWPAAERAVLIAPVAYFRKSTAPNLRARATDQEGR